MKLLLTSLLCLMLCPVWGGVEFDGDDDAIDVGTFDPATGDMTFSCWLKWYGDNSSHQIVFSKRDSWSASNMRWQIARSDSENQIFIQRSGDNADFNTDFPSTNTWFHFLVTKDGVSCTLFYDGVSQSSDNMGFGSDTAAQNLIGAVTDDTTTAFNGIIAEVAIWNVELTAGEIELLASSRMRGMPLQIQPSNLQAYWPLDDEPDGTSGDGDTFKDLSGNGRDGTGDDGAANDDLTVDNSEPLSVQPYVMYALTGETETSAAGDTTLSNATINQATIY